MKEDNNNIFLQTWRRRRSCDRCRRTKVRCEWATTDATVCVRCSKNNVTCHVTEQAPKIYNKRKRDPSAQFAYWVNKNAITKDERQRKLEQLETIQKEINTEMEQLRWWLAPIANAAAVNKKQSIDEIAHRQDCIQAVLENGLITIDQVDESFEKFMSQMMKYLPFELEYSSFDLMKEQKPVLALTIVVCSYSLTHSDDELPNLLERIFTERILQSSKSDAVEVIQSLTCYHLFMQPSNENRWAVYLLSAVSLADSAKLGCSEDAIIIKESTDPQEFHRARLRTQTFLALQCCLVATALHTSRDYLVNIVPPRMELLCEAMLRGSVIDKISVYTYKLVEAGHGLIGAAKRPSKLPHRAIINNLSMQRARLDTIYHNCYMAAEEANAIENFDAFKTLYVVIMLGLTENAANLLVTTSDAPPPSPETIAPLAQEIVRLSTLLIDTFVTMRGNDNIIPRIMYYRPLFALTSTIRARILLLSLDSHTEAFDIHVREQFQRVKNAWIPHTSVTSERMYKQLDKLEQWMQLQVSNKNESPITAPSSELLQRILRGVLTEHKISIPEQPSVSVPPLLDGNDPVAIDRMLRDLFAEVA